MKLAGPVAAMVVAAVTMIATPGCGNTDSSIGAGSVSGDSGALDAVHGDAGSSAAEEGAVENENIANENISVRIVDRAAYDEVVASHKGKVVLVDFWATWCGPCVQQFPHTVELSKKLDASDFAVVSVSMDEPSDEQQALKFLRKTGAEFDNLLSEYGVGQEGFGAFEIPGDGIPHYKIYDPSGAVHHTATSNEEIDQVIEKLLSEQ